MDRMMRGIFLLAGLLLAGPALADAVLPRLGPLPVLAEDGSVSGAADIPFGERLTILSGDGAVLTVQDGTGQQLRVRATDVIAAPKAGLTLMPADQLAGAATDRPDLQLWDSAFQLRVFLDGAGSGKIVPSMMIPAGSDLAKARLPVLSIDKAETSVGTPVTMVQALFPLLLAALDPAGQQQGRNVVLHVLVDGSDYARPFMVEKLRLLSRALAQQPDPFGDEVHFTRQVLFESGAVRDDGEVSASGLRSEWKVAKTTTKKPGLTAALSAAMQAMTEGINPSDGATHLVLILAGPGLSGDAAALKSATAVGSRLAKRRAEGADIGGILLAQGTPEPNPANGAVLAELAGGTQTKLADFGTDLMSELAALTAVKTHDPTADLVNTICADAAAAEIPCLVPSNSTWPPETASALAAGQQTTWVALPLWLVSESAPLDLVPDGSVPADVRGDQTDIRACGALGHFWDATNKACGPAEVAQGRDAYDHLIAAAQADISTATSERDAARAALAQKQLEWQDEKTGLGGQLSSAKGDRDAARDLLAKLQDTVASQTAALAEAQTTTRSLDQEGAAKAADEARAAQADISTAIAQRDAARDTLAQKQLEWQDEKTDLDSQLSSVEGDRDAARTSLAKMQDIVASQTTALADARALAQSRDEEGVVKAAVEARAAQAEISTAIAQRDAARDTLAQQQIEWQDEKTDLDSQLSSAEGDRDAARASLAKMQDTVASQTAALVNAQNAAAAQADQLAQLVAEEQAVQGDLLAAQNRAADLSGTLDQRTAELQAATHQIAMLGQQELRITAALDAAQIQLTTLEQTAATLIRSLDQEGAARVAVEANAAQAQAELQDRLKTTEARSAELEKTTAALALSLDDERAAKARVEAGAAQAQADHLKASAASSAALRTQIAQAETTIDALTAAKDDVSANLSTAEASQALAEQGLQDKDAKIAEQGAEIETLNGSVKDSVQQLADVEATLVAEREDSQTMLTKAAAEVDRLNGEVTDLSRTGDVNATLLAQSDKAKADLGALQTANDALSKANLTATSKLKALSGASGKTDSKLAQVSQDLAAARQKLEAVQSQSTEQIAALQVQVDDLTKARGDLADQIALLGVEKTRQVAVLQAQREAFAKQVSELEAQVKAASQVADLMAQTPQVSTSAEAPLVATEAVPRPKPRPAGLVAPAAASPKATTLAAPAQANPILAPRQVAPSLKAAALKGCQFEWTGQAGRLVCP